MSTVLINTNNQSRFLQSTEIVNLGKDSNALNQLGLEFNDADKKPILVPSRKVIDVVNDFSWYAGPKSTSKALDRTPCCFITEREQMLSSLISGGIYYLNAGATGLNNIGQSDFVQSLLGKAQEGGNVESAGNTIANTINGVTEAINTIAGTEIDRRLLSMHNLKSLDGIYYTRPTGFHYRFPLFDSPQGGLSQGFGSDPSGQVGKTAGEFIKGITELGETIGKAVNFAQPGVYIEKPQYFQGVNSGRSETVKFPLSNTIRRGTVSPIQQNFELLWLLAFHNRPYRTSFARTPPPKIYTVQVPGHFSMPYAYIEDMSVEFVGTVRKTKVYIPAGNGEGFMYSKQIKTDVPEAYQVSITFKSLLGEYANTMVSDAYNTFIDGDANKVTIGKAPRAEVVGPPPTTTR